MRIVSRAELLDMPRGTLFAQASGAGVYGELCIFGGPFGPDFTERSITGCQSDGSDDQWEREEAMWDSGASYPVNEDFGREGYFDHSMRYVVYEAADIASIVAGLQGDDNE